MCAAAWQEPPAAPHLPFSLLAGRYGATINSGNAGRYDVGGVLGYCAALKAEIADRRVNDDSLYVLSPGQRAALATSRGRRSPAARPTGTRSVPPSAACGGGGRPPPPPGC